MQEPDIPVISVNTRPQELNFSTFMNSQNTRGSDILVISGCKRFYFIRALPGAAGSFMVVSQ